MVKMTDIAAKAGVSQATVSLVLNNRIDGVRISEATRQRVVTAAQELGYQRNEVARAMVTGRTRILGFVSGTQESEESSLTLAGLMAAATESEHNMRVFPIENTRSDYELGRACVEQRVVGLAAQDLSEAIIERIQPNLDRFKIPIVMLGGAKRVQGVLRILCDETQGTADALRHLRALGHTKIGWVQGMRRASCLSGCRESSFREACGRAAVEVRDDLIVGTLGDDTDFEPALCRLLGSPARPTALLCCCDRIAMRAMRAVRKAGLSVPKDVSVVGCGGLSWCEFTDPPLSSITVPHRRMGARAAAELIERSERKGTDTVVWDRDVVLATEFVNRGSTGPV